jgi:AcrR family transcriptional regulator
MRSEARVTEPEAGARERLLTAALTLFNEKGYAATSVRELVHAAGVTKPVLYYYFGNKEGIYLELMESSYRTFESLAAAVVSREGSAQEKIVQFCSDLFDISLERLPLVRLIYAIYYGPPQGAPQFDLEAFFVRMIEVIQQFVSAGVANGELKENRVIDVTRAILAILTSAINDQLCRREEKLTRDGMVRMLRLLMSGIANDSPALAKVA